MSRVEKHITEEVSDWSPWSEWQTNSVTPDEGGNTIVVLTRERTRTRITTTVTDYFDDGEDGEE